MPIPVGGGGLGSHPTPVTWYENRRSTQHAQNRSSGRPSSLLEISYFSGELQYVIFYNIILGLGKTTNSQDRFPVIRFWFKADLVVWLHEHWLFSSLNRSEAWIFLGVAVDPVGGWRHSRKLYTPALSEKLEYLFFSPQTFQCYFMNIHNKYFGQKYSPLYVLMSFQNCFGFFRTSIFRDIWRNIPRFI